MDSVIMMDRHSGRPRGFGFVTFSDPAVADRVLEEDHVIDGRAVRFSDSLSLIIYSHGKISNNCCRWSSLRCILFSGGSEEDSSKGGYRD